MRDGGGIMRHCGGSAMGCVTMGVLGGSDLVKIIEQLGRTGLGCAHTTLATICC